MTVLRRRTRFYGHGEPEPLDLRMPHLSGANLYRAYLSRAVGIINEVFERQTYSLEGATTLDGQKYEGWTDNEDRDKNG